MGASPTIVVLPRHRCSATPNRGGIRGQPAEGAPAATPRMDRRGFLQAAASLATITAMSPVAFARNFAPEAEPQRYPEPDVVQLDKRFTSPGPASSLKAWARAGAAARVDSAGRFCRTSTFCAVGAMARRA